MVTSNMTLEWQLVNGREVLFRIPILEPVEEAESREELDESEAERLADLYSIAANERRLKMMSEMWRKGEMQFSDLLDVAENPKLVVDCVRPLVEGGMVSHQGRGSCYRPTRAGFAFAITMTRAVPRLLEFLEEDEEGEEETSFE